MASCLTCRVECGNAACIHGKPSTDIKILIKPDRVRSQWYAVPFSNLWGAHTHTHTQSRLNSVQQRCPTKTNAQSDPVIYSGAKRPVSSDVSFLCQCWKPIIIYLMFNMQLGRAGPMRFHCELGFMLSCNNLLFKSLGSVPFFFIN